MQILSNRVQQLEIGKTSQDAELARLRAGLQASGLVPPPQQQQQPQLNQHPTRQHQRVISTSEQLTISQMQMRQLQAQIQMSPTHAVGTALGPPPNPPSPLAPRHAGVTGPRAQSPLQPLAPTFTRPGAQLSAATSPARLPLQIDQASYTFGGGSAPSPISPIDMATTPGSAYSHYIPLGSNLARSNSYHEYSLPPRAAQQSPFMEHGISLSPSGEEFDPSDSFDVATGGHGAFGAGGMVSASPDTTNLKRSRTRTASDGVAQQQQRPRGASFSAIAPIVAQAKWMASQQPGPPPVQAVSSPDRALKPRVARDANFSCVPLAWKPDGTQSAGCEHSPASDRAHQLPRPRRARPRDRRRGWSSFAHTLTPLHLRHLLTMEHLPQSFVRRILTHNDQQCSMYLQQRLKTTPHEARKTAIIDAVGKVLLELCLSKFGESFSMQVLPWSEQP